MLATTSPDARHDQSLVSIIVPVYGTEAVLPELLDSLLAQSWSAWEAVLVIDGSPDEAAAVAHRYAARDGRFRVIETPNGGIGRARNIGLDAAAGDLIAFCDSDDMLEPNAIEVLVAALESSGTEMATAIGVDFFPGGVRRRRSRYWTMHGPQFRRGWATYALPQMPPLLEDHVVWAKLFRRSLIDRIGLRFPEGVQCEDILPMLRLQLAAHDIAVAPVEVYLHRRHEHTVSADYLRPSTLGDWLEQAAATIDEVVAHGDRAAVEHYVGVHTLGQWWTRAELVPLVEDRALVEGIERLAARMVEVLGDDLDELDPVRAAALRFFAAGGASRRWAGLPAALARLGSSSRRSWDATSFDVVVSPLVSPSPRTAPVVAEAALDAAGMLEVDDAIEARMAAELLVSRAVLPVAHGFVTGDHAADLLRRAEAALERVPRAALQQVAPPSAPARRAQSATADAAWAVLDGLPLRRARLTMLRVEGEHLVLRGEVELSNPLHLADRLSIAVRSTDGRYARVAPAWARAIEGGVTAWSARIALGTAAADRTLAVALRRERRGRGPVELPVVARALPGTLRGTGEVALRVEPLAAEPLALRVARRRGTALAPSPAEAPARRVYAYPNWMSNPYVTMLQTAARARGDRFDGTVDPRALIGELRSGHAGVVHVQWTSPITEKARDDQHAGEIVDDVLEALDHARAAGRPILWTVHNVLPHDTRFREAAIRLHQGIADRAHLIHVLGSTTQEAIGDLYELPVEKLRVLPHSSYAGIYGARVEQSDARAAIGSAPGTTQALFFGQMRPYKGLEHLFGAAIDLQDEHPVELLLAGNPTPELRAQIDELDETEVAITSALRFIEDDEVADWFSAADVAVLPYRHILNSGSMHLAATYGLPVILPDEHTITADYGDQAWIRFFDPADAQRSIAALLRDDWYRDPAVRAAALAYAQERSPYAMAVGFVELLDEVEAIAARSR
ncbi:Glycosyl transferases group 1 [Agrococcus carbonis]|uniref:Glycosyl transferases group 1 n=2 Tax=Agrococcus carbonis TaxID=684552 RepID=A0A1H1M4T6_9MICO|nr:Glycosyl transferases group 1 [Agrococcus carbonis]